MVEYPSLEHISLNHAKIREVGKINMYSLRHTHRNTCDNFSTCLPGNKNETFLTHVCENLKNLSDKECVPFNAYETKCLDNTYEWLSMDGLMDTWEPILQRLSTDYNNLSYVDVDMSKANLSICELEYGTDKYYICTKQEDIGKAFKQKYVWIKLRKVLKDLDITNLIALRRDIDFIVCDFESKKYIFILNKSNFISVFNYYEHLKRIVKDHMDEMENWTYLTSTELIKKKVDTKYVYLPLSKIILDKDYLYMMKNIDPSTLKKRLIKRTKTFEEEDFDGDKIKLTENNLKKVMKMISKGFKYDFFRDIAEE